MGGRDAAWFALTAIELARLTGVHVTTARRWLRRRAAPPVIERCLALLRAGELGSLSPAWSGWALRAGTLVSPEGQEYSPGEVRAAPLERAIAAELRRELEETQRLVRDGDSLEELGELRSALHEARELLEELTDRASARTRAAARARIAERARAHAPELTA